MRIVTVIAAFVTALTLAGCANVNVTINTDNGTSAPSGSTEDLTDVKQQATTTQSVIGPYGKLDIELPADWECKICPMDNDEMSYGYYGFTVHPKEAKEGIVAIFCAYRFGVCGTELKQEETEIAGRPARIGTYDDHARWDFVVIGNEDPQIVATNGLCESWTEDQWSAAQEIIDSVSFDPSVTEGAVWQYTPESEDTDIGVSMDLSDITPAGATVHFYRFDTEKAGEISYGDSFVIEKENDGNWEEVPVIIEDAAFTDIAHIIPQNDTCEAKIDWEWLYGPLSPGTYRLRKTVINSKDNAHTEHELIAQFLLAGSPQLVMAPPCSSDRNNRYLLIREPQEESSCKRRSQEV